MNLAKDYKRRGWTLVLIPANEKAPKERDWDERDPSLVEAERHLERSGNLGLILGPPSGETVDADLDCPEALALASLYLQATGAIFGRASRPMSHRLYIALGATYEAFADPLTDDMLIELRAQGRTGGAHQTLLPPSIADGERREWHDDTIAPAVIEASRLRRRCAWLAIGCLVRRYVSESAAEQPTPDLPRLLWECDHDLGRAAYRWLGEPAPDKPRHGFQARPRREWAQKEIDLADLVAAIPNNHAWDGWNRVGMAIFAASGGSDQGGIIFDAWSAKSPKYDPNTTIARWRHYHRSPPSRIGLGTLIHLAREAGWRPTGGRAAS